MNVQDMSVEEFQELAAAVVNRLGSEPYTVNKGVFELCDDFLLSEMQTNLGQYNSFDR